jgi:hypothetical protein
MKQPACLPVCLVMEFTRQVLRCDIAIGLSAALVLIAGDWC